MNIKKALRNILSAKERIDDELDNKIPFSALVEVTSGHQIIPVDMTTQEHTTIIESVVESAETLVEISENRGRRITASRVNEVGNALEDEFVDAIRANTNLSIETLGSSGYPDLKITHNGLTVYVELKTTSRGFGVSQRTFYYSSSRKINNDAIHILLGFKVSEDTSKHWRVDEWKLVDLHGLQTKLKNEFNATNSEVYANDIRLKESTSPSENKEN